MFTCHAYFFAAALFFCSLYFVVVCLSFSHAIEKNQFMVFALFQSLDFFFQIEKPEACQSKIDMKSEHSEMNKLDQCIPNETSSNQVD